MLGKNQHGFIKMKKGGIKMKLIEYGAIAALLELGFWCAIFIAMYRHNRRECHE